MRECWGFLVSDGVDREIFVDDNDRGYFRLTKWRRSLLTLPPFYGNDKNFSFIVVDSGL